ncbi:MAG: hypothetical protein KAT15_28450, partial [Bacteroidales bacterium]|nr:hypothetical protein [Bacteroidales bacterium]
MKIESKIGKSSSSQKQIYTFITDFNNFKDLLPKDKVSGWESSPDSCSFQVDPLGRTGIQIISKEPHSLVKMASMPEFSRYQFNIWIQLKSMSENDTRIKITIEPLVNKMILTMIKLPLKKFVDGLVKKIEDF